MNDPLLARIRTDPKGAARRVAHAHAAFLAGGELAEPPVRDVVARSWLRSARAHVDPAAAPPVALADDALAEYRAGHPLAAVIGVLRDLVGEAAEDGEHLMAVCDADGRLLWVEGHRASLRRAEAMNFVEGAIWDERHAGTNAPGTALALGEPVQIFATEHFLPAVQPWTCAAAPIRDPATGTLLGAIDITGGHPVAHPHSLALVRAAARAAEAELGWRRSPLAGILTPAAAERPAGSAPADGAWRLSVLGRHDGLIELPGRQLRLNRRHAEILFMLTELSHGATGEQLADAIFPEFKDPAVLRVELTRLRRAAGDLVASRPYRLTRALATDYQEVTGALRRGDAAVAVAGYGGPLLPESEAPGIIERRQWLETRLRAAVLSCADHGPLTEWAERFGFDDLEAWEHLTGVLPAGSGRQAAAAARTGELRAEYGLAGRRA